MNAALALAASGWYVFPLRPRDKRPAAYFTRWESRATRDPDLIYSLWQDAPYNIGLATGPSQLLVIDCDTGRGETPPAQWPGVRGGLDVLERLAHGAGTQLPRTLTVRTPSGGHTCTSRLLSSPSCATRLAGSAGVSTLGALAATSSLQALYVLRGTTPSPKTRRSYSCRTGSSPHSAPRRNRHQYRSNDLPAIMGAAICSHPCW
jgi:hypothetical protein